MEIHIADQLRAVVYAFCVGAFLAAVFDLFRITRVLAGLRDTGSRPAEKPLPLVGEPIRFRRPSRLAGDVFVFAEDLLFFLFASFTYTVFLFHANDGNSRAFLTVSALAGFFSWFFTVGKLTVRFSGVIRRIICVIAAYLRFFLLLPVRLARRFIFIPAAKRISLKKAEKRTEKAQKTLAKALDIVYNINNI